MRPTQGVAVVGACLVALLSVAGTVAASCWTCEHQIVNEQGAYVCVSAGLGGAGYTDCTPEWESDDLWCKFSGAPCTGDGGWRPPRYPVSLLKDVPMVLTTQVLVYSFGADVPAVQPGLLAVPGPGGMEPLAVAKQLAGASELLPALLAYSEESAARTTLTRYRGADGSGVVLSVQPLHGGFVIALRDAGSTGVGQSQAPVLVSASQAGVFSARVDGRNCIVVVHPALTARNGRTIERAVAPLHQPFIEAAEGYPNQDLMGLKADRPSGEAIGDTAELVRAMTSQMLMTSLLTLTR